MPGGLGLEDTNRPPDTSANGEMSGDGHGTLPPATANLDHPPTSAATTQNQGTTAVAAAALGSESMAVGASTIPETEGASLPTTLLNQPHPSTTPTRDPDFDEGAPTEGTTLDVEHRVCL